MTHWATFLAACGTGLTDDPAVLRKRVENYHTVRRKQAAGSWSPRTWNRAVAALDRFYRYAVDRELIARLPFSYRELRGIAGGAVAGTVTLNLAKERAPSMASTLRWLEDCDLALLLDVGFGATRKSLHGEQNRAMAGLVATSGLRLQEFSHLLVTELPALPTDARCELVPFTVPGAIAKRGKGRTTIVSVDALRRVWDYVHLERDLVRSGACGPTRAPC